MALVFNCDVCAVYSAPDEVGHFGTFVKYDKNGDRVEDIEMCSSCSKRVEKFIGNGLVKV
jgi:hypothetical protein